MPKLKANEEQLLQAKGQHGPRFSKFNFHSNVIHLVTPRHIKSFHEQEPYHHFHCSL